MLHFLGGAGDFFGPGLYFLLATVLLLPGVLKLDMPATLEPPKLLKVEALPVAEKTLGAMLEAAEDPPAEKVLPPTTLLFAELPPRLLKTEAGGGLEGRSARNGPLGAPPMEQPPGVPLGVLCLDPGVALEWLCLDPGVALEVLCFDPGVDVEFACFDRAAGEAPCELTG